MDRVGWEVMTLIDTFAASPLTAWALKPIKFGLVEIRLFVTVWSGWWGRNFCIGTTTCMELG